MNLVFSSRDASQPVVSLTYNTPWLYAKISPTHSSSKYQCALANSPAIKGFFYCLPSVCLLLN